MPSDPHVNPLKPEDCSTLNQVLQSCHSTDCLIQKLKDCGVNMDEYEAMNNEQKKAAAKFKEHFFPHNP